MLGVRRPCTGLPRCHAVAVLGRYPGVFCNTGEGTYACSRRHAYILWAGSFPSCPFQLACYL